MKPRYAVRKIPTAPVRAQWAVYRRADVETFLARLPTLPAAHRYACLCARIGEDAAYRVIALEAETAVSTRRSYV